MTYEEARHLIIKHLRANAVAHRAGDYASIGVVFDDVDASLPRDRNPRWRKIGIAHEFWGGWADSRNHDWRHYEPIRREDWASLADQAIAALVSDNEITDPIILERFSATAHVPLSQRVQSFVKRFLGARVLWCAASQCESAQLPLRKVPASGS